MVASALVVYKDLVVNRHTRRLVKLVKVAGPIKRAASLKFFSCFEVTCLCRNNISLHMIFNMVYRKFKDIGSSDLG